MGVKNNLDETNTGEKKKEEPKKKQSLTPVKRVLS